VVSDAISVALKLTPPDGATSPDVYLSGELEPFPVMAASQPRMQLTIGPVTHTVALLSRPATLEDAVSLLETAIRAFVEPEFANAREAQIGNQILLVPGAGGPVKFDQVPGGDQSSVVELELFAATPVRVRVNGAESLNEVSVNLT
jgi:hypothetical protein